MPAWKPCLAAALLLGSSSAEKLQQPLGAAVDEASNVPADATDKVKPLINSTLLQASISGPRLLGHAKTLFGIAHSSFPEYNHPTRVIGSAGHNGTLDYIYSVVSKLGDGYYNVWNQTFPAVSGTVFESRLVLNATFAVSAHPMGLTPPTANHEPVSAPLALVRGNGCAAADYPAAVKGAIALIERGVCPFGDKSALAGRAGAVAAVVYNNEAGSVSGTLGTPSPDHVATFGLARKEGLPLVAALRKGAALDGTAYLDSEVNTILTKNILAQTVEGDPDNCVMLGGHSDSVTEGPGINDDGSGSLTLLEVAAQLTKFRVNNCVRFAWWAAEEEGLLGSDYYAATLPAEENLKVRLFMDYDMLASPNFAYQVYNATDAANPAGSEALRNLYIDWYKEQGLHYMTVPFDGRSDYDGFIRAGIPAGGIATGAEGIKTPLEALMFGGTAGDWYDPCYHQLCDDVGNLNLTAWEINTKLVAHSVATYALSFDGFPERTLDSVTAASAAYGSTVKYHGSKLVL